MRSLKQVFVFLLALGLVCCQNDKNSPLGRTFPQWLTGLIAVTVFLFLVLVAYMVNRVWNKKTQDVQQDTTMNSIDSEDVLSNGTYKQYTVHNVRSSEHEHAYDNPTEVTDNVLTTAM
ncbi:PDZK1-interacting protein 1 [Pelodytes ibericus]